MRGSLSSSSSSPSPRLWAASRIPDGIHDHEVFWISAVGVLNLVAIAGRADRRDRTTQRTDAAGIGRGSGCRMRRLTTALCVVFLAGLAVAGVRELKTVADRSRVMTRGDLRIDHATRAVEAEIARTGARRPKMLIDQPVWEAAAGVILQLRRKGTLIAVQPGLENMFSGTVAADGTEDLEITFCGGPCHDRAAARPDNTVVLLGDGLAIDAIVLEASRTCTSTFSAASSSRPSALRRRSSVPAPSRPCRTSATRCACRASAPS